MAVMNNVAVSGGVQCLSGFSLLVLLNTYFISPNYRMLHDSPCHPCTGCVNLCVIPDFSVCAVEASILSNSEPLGFLYSNMLGFYLLI